MTRIPLKEGEIIQLGHYNYTVSKAIGDGATCVVYSAYYTDSQNHAHKVNIKECYPHNADITREGQALCWASQEEQGINLATFRAAYAKLMEKQNGNFTVHAFDLFESNNTAYIVMDANVGETFDKAESKTLADILKTIRLLTYVVGTYHDNGYLHLDIKPGNFLVYPRPSEHIVLFDMDTVTPIEKIRQGNINAFSYSDRWAAPEQKQGQFSKLCPATDLFAIGTVLFEKIMGRPVTAADMGVFSEWKFDGELFDEINPKIKRLLSNIFKKTLSANIKRRYQSAEKLLAALDEAIKVATDTVYLTSNCPPLSTNFIGREFEILRIRQAFDAKNRAVFLSGEGGIGKSMLAQAYANQFRQDYDVILFYRYKESLESLINSIAIQNFDTSVGNKREKLFSLLNERTLLIIDNFNVETDEDAFLEAFLRYDAHILFTTRTDFSVMTSGQIEQLTIMKLPDPALRQLFSHASGQTIVDEEVPLLQKLLKSVDFNTYATELLGAQMKASDYSLEALVKIVSPGLDALDRSERIRANKDGHISKGRIPQIIRELFKVADLSEERKQVLRNMYLLRFVDLDRVRYCEFTRCNISELDALNDLLELRWIRKAGLCFTIHPLVEEIVKNDLDPNEKNCEGFYYSVFERMGFCCQYEGYGDADEYRYDRFCEFLCAFFETAAPKREYDRNLMYIFLLDIIKNEENAYIGSPNDSCFTKLYAFLEQREKEPSVSATERMKIRYILLAAWGQEFRFLYPRNSYGELLSVQRRERFLECFWLAVSAANELDAEKREEMLDKVYSLGYLAYNIVITDVPSEFFHDLYRDRPNACTLSARDKKSLGLPLSKEEQEEADFSIKLLSNALFDQTNNEIEEEQLQDQFLKAENKVAFVENIIEDSSLSAMERARILGACTSAIFFPLYIGDVERFWSQGPIDWCEMEQMLDVEEEFLISDECLPKKEDYADWISLNNNNTINLIFVYAMRDDQENYKSYMSLLLERHGRKISRYLKESKVHWTYFVDPKSPYNDVFSFTLRGLMDLKKASWILPYLIRFADGWEAYAKEKGYEIDDEFFSIYKNIFECAWLAEAETEVPLQYQQNFDDIFLDYYERVKKITGTEFTLRSKDD